MEENNELNGNSNVNKVNNKNALASFICSLVGLIIFPIPCGIAALICGILGITKFNPETEKNKWMAIFGIVVGILGMVASIVLMPYTAQMVNELLK